VTRYKRTQIGHVVIWAVLVISVVVAIGTISQPSRSHEISVVISLLLLVTIPLFCNLRIEIDDQTLLASFGIGAIRKKCRSPDYRMRTNPDPLVVRLGNSPDPYGWLYNVSGLDAVAITLRNGRKFAFGTDDPHGLVAAIRGFSSAE
jgi:hypothetical protein